MNIELSFHHLRLPRNRFEISSGLKDNVDVFLLEARRGSFVGIGSGSPATSVGDSPKKCANALSYIQNLTLDPDAYFDGDIPDEMKERSPAASATLDIAMWDLRAKMDGVSLTELLGGHMRVLPTDATIDLKKPDDARKEAARFIKEGFKSIKVKVGKSIREDLERVRAVRETTGSGVQLIIDANGGYDSEKALTLWEDASEFDLEFFEQPVPQDMVKELAMLRGRGVRVCADESFVDEGSLMALIDLDATDMINIKLMKLGGLTQAMRLERIAREAGIGTMIGCMGDIGISIGAAAHLACKVAPSHVDLDSHLNIAPICDGPLVKSGNIQLKDEPGIGVYLIEGWQNWRV